MRFLSKAWAVSSVCHALPKRPRWSPGRPNGGRGGGVCVATPTVKGLPIRREFCLDLPSCFPFFFGGGFSTRSQSFGGAIYSGSSDLVCEMCAEIHLTKTYQKRQYFFFTYPEDPGIHLKTKMTMENSNYV